MFSQLTPRMFNYYYIITTFELNVKCYFFISIVFPSIASAFLIALSAAPFSPVSARPPAKKEVRLSLKT